MFLETVYESDERTRVSGPKATYLIRLDEDLLTFQPDDARANAPDDDPPTIPVHVHSTPNRDAGGLRVRGVSITWTGSPPDGYDPDGKIFIPVLQPSRFAEYKIGQTGTFRGAGFVIVGKRPEVIEG